jgi:hypothetical protein
VNNVLGTDSYLFRMKIKKTILTTLVLFFLANQIHAQITFGVKAGINLSKGNFDSIDGSNKLGINAGLLSEIKLGEKFLLRPEVFYSAKGWKFPAISGSSGGSINLHYVTIPVLFGYRPISKLSILAGAELGYLLKTVRKPEANMPQIYNYYEKLDYGICLGLAYNLTKSIGVEMRYVYGFDTLIKASGRDANNNATGEVYRDGANRVLQLNVFYTFKKD